MKHTIDRWLKKVSCFLDSIEEKIPMTIFDSVSSADIEQLNCAALRTRMAARSVSRTFDRALKPAELRITQFTLLVVISKEYPMSSTEMADLLAIERSSLVRSIQLLEKKGLVHISGRANRGAHRLALTALGKKKLAVAIPLWRKAQREVIGSIGDTQWVDVSDSLEKLTRATVKR